MSIFNIYSRGKFSYTIILLLIVSGFAEALTSNSIAGFSVERGYNKQELISLMVAACFFVGLIWALCIRVVFTKSPFIRRFAFHFFMFPMFIVTALSITLYFFIKSLSGVELIYGVGIAPILLGMRFLYRDN